MIPNTGDRYEYYYSDAWAVLLEWNGSHWRILKGHGANSLHKLEDFCYMSSEYIYLGNFSKSENFSNLFEILNEKP